MKKKYIFTLPDSAIHINLLGMSSFVYIHHVYSLNSFFFFFFPFYLHFADDVGV